MKKPIFSNEQIKAKNKYWTVIQRDFIDSQGRSGDVITMKSSKSGNGSSILALTKDNKIILSCEYFYGTDEFVYELPGGFIEKGSNSKENSKKELLEETGYSSKDDVLVLSKTIQNKYIGGYIEHFLLKNCEKIGEPKTHEGEEIKTILFDLKEFEEIINGLNSNIKVSTYAELAFRKARSLNLI